MGVGVPAAPAVANTTGRFGTARGAGGPAGRRWEVVQTMPQGTVLVVDDDDSIRNALKALLEDEGYLVQAAGNGLEALIVCGRGLPSLIVLDLMMPKMDGVTFMEVLRRGYACPPPVLVLSASQKAPEQVKRMGVEGYLAKPFDLDDLLAAVGRLVRV
jgi:two-component system, OmpR family, response regulator MprA